MSLSHTQKIGLAFFICTLAPAYLIANWRHAENLSALTDKFEREQQLHLSTDKLLSNCVRNEAKENDHYSATHQICEQGLSEHELTTHAMDVLTQEKAANDTRWYRNFFLSVLIFNLMGWTLYKANTFLRGEENNSSV